ncbi:MAG: DNA polymerase III subunit beta [Acidobacteriota bacterium]|nr:DNA polymerase III subunit beta [Acidobacteriota bacterium]
MEFTARKAELQRELDLAQGVAEKKTTIPILSNILIEANDSELRLSATDLELGLRCGCPAQVRKTGALTVPSKRLLDIVASLPDAEIKFKALENHFIQVTCGRSSFRLAGMVKDNFPALPEIPAALATIPAGALAPMIKRTTFAIASEESRYTLNGALLLLKPDRILMVATDGHRLAQVEKEAAVEGLNTELRILIPKKAMGEVERLIGQGGDQAPVYFSKDESHLFFSVGRRVLISRVLTGQFPNYEAVLPRDNNRIVEAGKKEFTEAIRRVALLADERSRVIRFQIGDGRIEMSSANGDYGEASDQLEVEYAGEPMQIGFNFQYLLDFLMVAGESEKIRLELKDEQSAGQFRPSEDDACRYRYVVMPMRV